MKKGFNISAVILLLSSGCIQVAPSEDDIPNAQTKLAGEYAIQTEQAKPTSTPIPTNTPVPTPLGSSSGKILFEQSRIDNDEISDFMIVDIESKEIVNLTNNQNNSTSYYYPSVSPDGTKIAYSLLTKEDLQLGEFWKHELFIMDIDGNNKEKISSIQMYLGNNQIDTLLIENQPAWSPDGKNIAFSSNRNSLLDNLIFDDAEIYVINLDNYEIQQLTKARDYSNTPSWSPDGQQIAFMSNRDGDWDIYIMNSDGTGMDENITKNTSSERFPSWSNDGKFIVYHSDRDGNNNLYLYNLETGEETRLTNKPSSEFTGRWSHDDNWITFASDRDGDYEIYIINVKTKEEIKITDNDTGDGLQNWIP